MKRLFGTMHEDIWKQLFKAQKSWPMKTEDIGLHIDNPASVVSIIFSKTYLVNTSNIIKIILPTFHIGLDGKGGADQLSRTAV